MKEESGYSSGGGGLSLVDERSPPSLTASTMSPKQRMLLEQRQSRPLSDPQRTNSHSHSHSHSHSQSRLQQGVMVGTPLGTGGLVGQGSAGGGSRHAGDNETGGDIESNGYAGRIHGGLGMTEAAVTIAETAPPPYHIPDSVTSPTGISSPEPLTSSSAFTSRR